MSGFISDRTRQQLDPDIGRRGYREACRQRITGTPRPGMCCALLIYSVVFVE